MKTTITAYPPAGSMVDGYDYDASISFDPKYGWLKSGQFPAECIEDCSASGRVDDAVEYWRKRLKFVEALEPIRAHVESYLREYGAWDDLAEVDIDTLANRVLWIACGDIREQGEWFGVCN